MAIEVGQEAPDFELTNQHGEKVRLSSYRGAKNVVLMFFPKAFTGICTDELCAIRDETAIVEDEGTVVLSVSCDTSATHKAFADAQGYTHQLLSDFWPHGAVAQSYGVFLDAAGIALRATFVIDREGVVRWTVVNQPGDARSVADYTVALAAI
jgi:peroxiredoxin